MGLRQGIITEADLENTRDYSSEGSILPFSNMGMPVHEGQTATALIQGAESRELKKLGLPLRASFAALRRWSYGGCFYGCSLREFARELPRRMGNKPVYSHIYCYRGRRCRSTIWMKCSTRSTTKCHPVNGIHQSHIIPDSRFFSVLPQKERLVATQRA